MEDFFYQRIRDREKKKKQREDEKRRDQRPQDVAASLRYVELVEEDLAEGEEAKEEDKQPEPTSESETFTYQEVLN